MALRTTTVAELRNLLADYDNDQRVAFSSDYGDRTHTEQVLPIEGHADLKLIEKSGYSESGWAVREELPDAEEREMEDFEEPEEILVIN